MEHSICMFIPNRMRCYDDAFLKALIDAAGVDRTFFGSDLGQTNAPLPVEGFRQIIATCLAIGYSPDDVRKMVGTNAAQLAGIGANAP
jgi:predicted TIM-barrel fold metal-dependent hydrolase